MRAVLRRRAAEPEESADRSVDVQIVGLRRKMGAHGALIETVRGVGYRLRMEEA